MGLVGLLRSFGGTRTHVLAMSIVCNVCIRRVECPVFQCEANGNYGIFEGAMKKHLKQLVP